MKTRSKLLMAALTASLLMSIGVGTAAALRSLGVSATQIRGTSRVLTFAGGGVEVICEVTLNTTLRASIAKSEVGRKAGETEARVQTERCSGGRARVLGTLFQVNYEGFTGTLPSISTVKLGLVEVAFLVQVFGGLGECLYRGKAAGSTVGGTRVTEIRADESLQVRLFRNLGGLSCPAEGVMRGSFRLERTVTVSLL